MMHANVIALGKQPVLSSTTSKLNEKAEARTNAVIPALKTVVYFL